ncbi:hypothetical protein D3C84_608880 [compost metagenome]
MVVRPVAAVVGAVRRTFALVEFGADQHVDDQAVRHVHAPDLAGRQGCVAAQLANDMNGVLAVQYLRVSGNQYTHIVQLSHGPGQRCGNVTQPAGLHQIGNFGGDEQDFLSIGIVPGNRCQRLGARDADRLGTACTHDARLADLLMSTFSLNI